MDVQASSQPAVAVSAQDAWKAAQALGRLLAATAQYQAFLETLRALDVDLDVQRLGVEMRSHQIPLQWGQDADGQHAAALERLQRELEEVPVVQRYRQAEAAVRQLCVAVDAVISQEAGVAFAVNARRSGCSCGQ